MEEHFSANGKLLISGEYAVLYGARAFALPCRFGQHLQIKNNKDNAINWQSRDYQNNIWFDASFNNDLEITDSSDNLKAIHLQKLLFAARELSEINHINFNAETKLDFPNFWGLGSSSTLLYLIASFYRIDPFKLFTATTKGSGYDIACAGENNPLVYFRKKNEFSWHTVKIPEVYESCYFIHLNKKQNSRTAIREFDKREFDHSMLVNRINKLTTKFLNVGSINHLQRLMYDHEQTISEVLGVLPIKERLFADFNGSIKSLGAWGGDFIMALGEDVEGYFKKKNYPVIIPFREMAAI